MIRQVFQTNMASYLQAFASALGDRGIDAGPVFERAGLEVSPSSDPLKRITEFEISRLFEVAVEATGDPCFGFAVGERMQPGNLHALGFGLLSSSPSIPCGLN